MCCVEKFGEICHVEICFHMTDFSTWACFVAKSVLSQFTRICREICFLAIYAVLLQNIFCRDRRTFCVETNYSQNIVRGGKCMIISGQNPLNKVFPSDTERVKSRYIGDIFQNTVNLITTFADKKLPIVTKISRYI